MDGLTIEQRSRTMARIKSSGTSIEVLLRKALWREGIRYRKNLKTLPGKPDIAITKHKLAIFCDGELWHGRSWETKMAAIKTNRDYWIPKIERNMARDDKNEKDLKNMGWTVLRFWGEDIKKDLAGCVSAVKEAIFEIRCSSCKDKDKDSFFHKEGYSGGQILLVAENGQGYGEKLK
jgi:DNA mismatch endonuclease (patch repair protein)